VSLSVYHSGLHRYIVLEAEIETTKDSDKSLCSGSTNERQRDHGIEELPDNEYTKES
jgi:hypothetical protein